MAFISFKAQTLLDKTISDIIESKLFSQIIIDTDDIRIIEYVNKVYPEIYTSLRKENLLVENTRMSKVLYHAVQNFILDKDCFDFDIISILPIHCPFRDKHDIIEGYQTLLLSGVDQVISVYLDLDLHFMHSINGLKPVNPLSIDSVRYERENLFVSNGAVHFFWKEQLREDSLYFGKIGHFEMSKERSFQIKNEEDLKYIKIYE
jgi:CMP-N-acetylneuraminic acid synthetase